MRLIWTASTLPFSKLIRWGFNIDCSHFAIVFNSPGGGIMFESNLLGTHPKFFRSALNHMNVIHEISLDMPIEIEDAIWDRVVSELDGKPYDYKAFLYFSWRALLKKMFNIPIPNVNKYESKGTFLCTEVFSVLKGYFKIPDNEFDLGIIQPHQLYEIVQSLLLKYKEVLAKQDISIIDSGVTE